MGFLEGLLVKVLTGFVEKLTSYLYGLAKRSKLHSDDLKENRDKAARVVESADVIIKTLKNHKKVSKEMADALRERNRKLRSGGLN